MIIPLAAKAFLGKVWPYLAVAGVVALVLMLTYCTGQKAGTTKADNSRLKANSEVQTKKAGADAKAGDERLGDAARNRTQREELRDAQKNAVDPADAHLRRGCRIMRQQGTDTSRVPACKRLGI